MVLKIIQNHGKIDVIPSNPKAKGTIKIHIKIEEREEYPKHRNIKIHKTLAKIPSFKLIANSINSIVATPLPPLNFRYIGNI